VFPSFMACVLLNMTSSEPSEECISEKLPHCITLKAAGPKFILLYHINH